MSDLRIDVLDVHDDDALEQWHAVTGVALRHQRPFALQASLTSLRASVQQPHAHLRRVLFVARRDGAAVGTAELRLGLTDNTHLAALEVHVLPDERRSGVGASLHDAADRIRREEGRTTVVGELHVPIGGPDAGLGFAGAMGFTSVHAEEHLAMRLPADPITADLLTRDVPGYELVSWQGPCPDEHRAAYLRMRNQMNADVPTGGVDAAPVVLDEERLQQSEARAARSYLTLVVAARRTSDGVLGGYSLVYLDHTDDVALQDDTLVMPEHRGRGIGMQLKQAARAILETEHPDRTVLHTWTDPTNAAMYRTNIAFGYAPVELTHEVQRVD